MYNGADISSLFYVKSNTFKIEKEKKSFYLQHFWTSNKGKHSNKIKMAANCLPYLP